MEGLKGFLGGALSKVKRAKQLWDGGASPVKAAPVQPKKDDVISTGVKELSGMSARQKALKEASEGL